LDNCLCRDRRQPATASYIVSNLASLLARKEGKCCYIPSYVVNTKIKLIHVTCVIEIMPNAKRRTYSLFVKQIDSVLTMRFEIRNGGRSGADHLLS
jgi:hypothetical protein